MNFDMDIPWNNSLEMPHLCSCRNPWSVIQGSIKPGRAARLIPVIPDSQRIESVF